MRFVILFLIFVFFMGCAASRKTVTEPRKSEETSVKSTQFDESFDPLSLEDDDIVIEKRVQPTTTSAPAKQISQDEQNTLPDSLLSFRQTDGFRVQIFAGRSIEAATMAEAKAKEDFEPKGYKVYLIFEAPFYKLRVGDFTDRNDADLLRSLAKSMGYKAAFVVRSKVNVPEQ